MFITGFQVCVLPGQIPEHPSHVLLHWFVDSKPVNLALETSKIASRAFPVPRALPIVRCKGFRAHRSMNYGAQGDGFKFGSAFLGGKRRCGAIKIALEKKCQLPDAIFRRCQCDTTTMGAALSGTRKSCQSPAQEHSGALHIASCPVAIRFSRGRPEKDAWLPAG